MSQAINRMIDWFESANKKFNLKNYREAIIDYTKAIEQNQDYVEAYYGRGLAKYSIGELDSDWEEAIADYTKVIDLKPDHPEAYFSRGLIKLFQENYQYMDLL